MCLKNELLSRQVSEFAGIDWQKKELRFSQQCTQKDAENQMRPNPSLSSMAFMSFTFNLSYDAYSGMSK